MRPKKPRHKRRPGKPQIELCKQVERALALALAGEFADPVICDLQVMAVKPAPNSARLLVTVSPSPSAVLLDTNAVTAHLARASGKLRCEIAAAIHRKKTPELAFCVLASGLAPRFTSV